MGRRYPWYIRSYFKRHKYVLSQSQLLAHILFSAWWNKFTSPWGYNELIFFFIYILLSAGKADVPYVISDEASGAYQFAPIEPAKATETNESMKLSEVEPCGELCFKLQDFGSEEKNVLVRPTLSLFYNPFGHSSSQESSPWSNPDDITMLEGILKLTPDTIPCDLAIICRKPCLEVRINYNPLQQLRLAMYFLIGFHLPFEIITRRKNSRKHKLQFSQSRWTRPPKIR